MAGVACVLVDGWRDGAARDGGAIGAWEGKRDAPPSIYGGAGKASVRRRWCAGFSMSAARCLISVSTGEPSHRHAVWASQATKINRARAAAPSIVLATGASATSDAAFHRRSRASPSSVFRVVDPDFLQHDQTRMGGCKPGCGRYQAGIGVVEGLVVGMGPPPGSCRAAGAVPSSARRVACENKSETGMACQQKNVSLPTVMRAVTGGNLGAVRVSPSLHEAAGTLSPTAGGVAPGSASWSINRRRRSRRSPR